MASTECDAGIDVMGSEDALEAMATGQFEAPSQASSPAGGETASGGVISEIAAPARDDPQQRQAARMARRQHTALVHGAQFKKTMVPLLLAVGVLLLVLSGITVFILLSSRAGQMQGAMLNEYGPTVVMVACPLAAVLLAGAWWFHREAGQAGGEQ